MVACFALLFTSFEKCGYRGDKRCIYIYMYILYRDISLNLREYREVSEARVGLHRENYLCKRMLIIDELSIAMFLSIRF